MLGNFHDVLLSANKLVFLQKFLQEHYQSVDRRSVGPDLGPSGLEKSSADDEIDNQQVKS